jgi:hypothetical protein
MSMLLTLDTWRAIERGEVTLQFRRWRRPTVKAGGQLRSSHGVLNIEAVERVDEDAIDDEAARRAGHFDRATLLEAMARRQGETYRIQLSYAGPDPRIALRQRDQLDEAEWKKLATRLDKMDEGSTTGPWTTAVLALIGAREGDRAVELAAVLGQEKLFFKRRVRLLKGLGLAFNPPRPGLRPRAPRCWPRRPKPTNRS